MDYFFMIVCEKCAIKCEAYWGPSWASSSSGCAPSCMRHEGTSCELPPVATSDEAMASASYQEPPDAVDELQTLTDWLRIYAQFQHSAQTLIESLQADSWRCDEECVFNLCAQPARVTHGRAIASTVVCD